jgi:hypothetical protein
MQNMPDLHLVGSAPPPAAAVAPPAPPAPPLLVVTSIVGLSVELLPSGALSPALPVPVLVLALPLPAALDELKRCGARSLPAEHAEATSNSRHDQFSLHRLMTAPSWLRALR